MTKLRSIAARNYLAIAKFNSPGGKRKIFFPSLLAIVVFALIFSAKTVFAEGEYGSLFAAGAGDFIKIIEETAVWVISGAFTAYLSANVLQWVVNNQTEMIQFNGDFIKNGLATTQGLADMLLILAFVIASFGIIFKVREFEAKKTVTTIVLTAIFTRFGALIVKMMVDIGNIAINTIVGDNKDLIVNATWPLVKDALFSAGTAMSSMALYAGALSVPYLNLIAVGVGVAGIGSVAAALITNNINAVAMAAVNFLVKWIFEIIACYTLSGVYITFILLFLSRVFMISILAVISPLAIMAYALPQTRKFYNQWWSSLFKWTFLGVWTLFFLMLGIGSAGFIMPTSLSGSTGTLSDGIFSQVIMDSGILYYLFLIVYLALVQNMANKESDGMASLFRVALVGAGAAVVSNVVKPAAGRARDFAVDKNMALRQKATDAPLSRMDRLIMHGSGIAAKALEEKQLDNYASMFSGDHKKAAAAAKVFNKSFPLHKLVTKAGREQFSNIDPMIDSAIAEVGKNNTVAGIIKKGQKATIQEAIWAMQSAKSEDLPELINALGSEKATDYLNYAIKEGKLTPTQIQAIARNTDALDYSSELRKYFSDTDKGGVYFERVKSFMGLGDEISPQQKSDADKLVARSMNVKGATRT